MKPITLGFALWVALLLVPGPPAAESRDLAALGAVPADTIPGVPAAIYLGVPVRVTFSDCGNPRLPRNHMTGTLLEIEQEALQLRVLAGDQEQLQQVSFNDLLRLEVGTRRTLKKQGGLIGALSGAALGLAGGAIAASGTSGDAEYAQAALFGGLLGAGVGALIGERSQTMEWREVPLYGDAYCR